MPEVFRKELDWLPGAAVLTAAVCIFAAIYIGDPARMAPMIGILAPWSAAMAILIVIGGLAQMASAGEPKPVKTGLARIRANRRQLATAFAILLLAGLNLVSFMWMKPILNVVVPFRADPLLADIDQAIFLGHEPWSVLQFANFEGAGYVYHPLWFVTVIAALLLATFARSSPERSAILLTYFVLWSVFAPLVHCLLPASGPVFYEAMGYGNRFAALPLTPETRGVADYLLSFYENGEFGTGNGISAMPSMHVTTSTWVVLATWVFARRYLPLALVSWVVIATMSVALGWHYFTDGLVGAAGATGIFVMLKRVFQRRQSRMSAAPAPVTA